MALSPSAQAYADTLTQLSGANPDVIQRWVTAEGNGAGANNFLNIMPNGHGVSFPSPQAGAAAAWEFLQYPNYAGVRSAFRSGTPAQQLQAIVASPWSGNHYAGTAFGSYVASLGSQPPQPTLVASGSGALAPVVMQTSGCVIHIPKLPVVGGDWCLLSASAGRKIAGAGAMGAGALLLVLGLYMTVGGSGLPSVGKIASRAGGGGNREKEQLRQENEDLKSYVDTETEEQRELDRQAKDERMERRRSKVANREGLARPA